MDLEMKSMYFNSVWKLIDQFEGVKLIECKWIYKRNRDSAWKVHTFKSRLGEKRTGWLWENFFPCCVKVYKDSLVHSHILLYEIWQMDVNTAFLNGNLEECIFMSRFEGFKTQGQKQKVCKLSWSINGLKQASIS